MRGIRITALIGAAVTTMALASSGFGTEYIVKLKSSTDHFDTAITDMERDNGLNVLDKHEQGSLLKVNLDGFTDAHEARQIANLYASGNVEYIVKNIKFHAIGSPNDPKFSEQWSLAKVNAERAWDITTGSKNVVVAITDTGIDYKHEDLKDNMWINTNEIAGNGIDDDGNGFVDDMHGWDFRDNDADPMDLTSDKNPGHGTHCAGIVGATGNNTKGISGMAQSISLMAVRFLGADGSGDLMTAAKAIDYATNNGANVISASWGAAVQRAQVGPIIEAIGRAEAKGVIFVAAAANDGKNNDSREIYPANAGLSNVISVAASQSDDTKPSWSNFGKMKVDLAAPGHKILSTLPGDKYGELSGTSMATPLVSGLVGLMMAASKDDAPLSGPVAKSLLQASGAKVSIETACDCRVDATKALAALTTEDLTVVPNAITIAPDGSQKFEAWGGQGPYTFAVGDAAVAGISADGTLKAVAEGETKVTVKDANGKEATSLIVRIATKPEGPSGECPLGDPMMCQLICAIQPTLPFCN